MAAQRPAMALLAAFLAALAAACGPEQVASPTPAHSALTGEVVKRGQGLLIVLTDDLKTVLINDRQAYGACLLHARYPACKEK